MRITARTFASLRELSVDRCELDLGPAATVEDAWSALQARYPALEPQRPLRPGGAQRHLRGME